MVRAGHGSTWLTQLTRHPHTYTFAPWHYLYIYTHIYRIRHSMHLSYSFSRPAPYPQKRLLHYNIIRSITLMGPWKLYSWTDRRHLPVVGSELKKELGKNCLTRHKCTQKNAHFTNLVTGVLLPQFYRYRLRVFCNIVHFCTTNFFRVNHIDLITLRGVDWKVPLP